MAHVSDNASIREYQEFVREVYGLSNDRNFSTWDMISNVERFAMRALKGVRKNDNEKTKMNLIISFSWFTSLNNQLHVDIEKEVWERFPYLCSYCASCPCRCREKKIETRQTITVENKTMPKTLREFQSMFQEIYPAGSRTVEQAGIHLAEELGEFSEALMSYRGNHDDKNFRNVVVESADVFSCFMSLFSSIGVSVAKELSGMFSENCHACKKAPCECSFDSVMKFES